jgi:hypothetical protein
VPVLEHDGLVLYESTAIILHLLESNGGTALVPEVGSRLRSDFYKWLMWLSTALHANLSLYLHPDKLAASNEAQVEIKDGAEPSRSLRGRQFLYKRPDLPRGRILRPAPLTFLLLHRLQRLTSTTSPRPGPPRQLRCDKFTLCPSLSLRLHSKAPPRQHRPPRVPKLTSERLNRRLAIVVPWVM